MTEWPIIAQAHLIVGSSSVVAGFAAMLSRKGSLPHRIAGRVFFYSMLMLCFSGFYLSATRSLQFTFFLAFLSLYLLATGWYAVSRNSNNINVFDKLGFFSIVAFGLTALSIASIGWLFEFGYPATEPPYPAYFVLVVFAGISARSDYTFIKHRGISNGKRLVRHLSRMSFSMLIATTIFFQGNSNILPEIFRHDLITALPSIAVIVFILFWLLYKGAAIRNT